jgi:protein-disulfide isomerase
MSRNQILLAVVVAALLAAAAAAWYDLRPPSGVPPTPGFVASSTDHALGNPKAPIVAIEYAAPQCPFCAEFNAKGMPHLKAGYIDTGKVFYIFRMFPIGPADVPAESIARCLPADKYFPFIDLLYRNQAKWDPENGVEDVHGALVAMARIAGLDAQKVDACIADKDVQKQIIAVAQDAQSRFGINGTPTFVLNGEVQSPGAPWEEIKAKLDSLLAKR